MTACLLLLSALTVADPKLIVNGSLERGLDGWNAARARTGKAIPALEQGDAPDGRQAARIEHTGTQDWRFQQQERLAVLDEKRGSP